MTEFLIYSIGFTAQVLFGSRLVIQWLKSEKAGKVVCPSIFWQLSLVASWLMIIYGMLRDDLVIILGQLISYFVYIRNLHFKDAWEPLPLMVRKGVLLFPVAMIICFAYTSNYGLSNLANQYHIQSLILGLGLVGQLIFSTRFIFQWYYSEQLGRSVLPLTYWLISIIGATIIFCYAIYRSDPVLAIGQLFGLSIYVRNTYLQLNSDHS